MRDPLRDGAGEGEAGEGGGGVDLNRLRMNEAICGEEGEEVCCRWGEVVAEEAEICSLKYSLLRGTDGWRETGEKERGRGRG